MLGRVAIFPAELASESLRGAVRAVGFDTVSPGSLDSLLASAEDDELDVLLLGLSDRADDSLDLCSRIAIHRPDVQVILVGDQKDFGRLLSGLRARAFDWLTLPIDKGELEASLHRALQHRGLKEEVRRLRTALAESSSFEELVGASPPMQRLYELLEQAANSQASVLVTGESGTGKELVARALHSRSTRGDGPFVAVNCAAIPENLLESELFGHVRGAFTDAKVARTGLFVKAQSGTLFLDEVGEMPKALQPKLLRALQERRVRPVGGDSEVDIDVRLIAATNLDLEQQVADGRFREDLFYRINVIQLTVPPLRQRSSDIVLLAQHYAEHFALLNDKPVSGISTAANEKLLAYPWPGNVRELQNCIERAVALTLDHEIQVRDLPERVRKHKSTHVLVVGDKASELAPMHEVERLYIIRVLQAVSGNKREAARILGFDRKTLYRKIERYGIVTASSEHLGGTVSEISQQK